MGIKYYYNIQEPHQKLKTENQTLKNRLSIIGNAKHLTDDQIIQKYDFMEHTENMPYLKIQILRALETEESIGAIEIKDINGETISSRTIDRHIKQLKYEIGTLLNTRVSSLSQLSLAAVKLDIIQVIVRQKDF